MTRFAIVLAVAGIFSGSARAIPITYTETGQLTGTLGNVTFTNTPFTFILNGDTDNILGGSSIPINIATSNSFIIGAFSGSLTSVVEAGVNTPEGIIGIAEVGQLGGITLISAGAVGYDLSTPISITGRTYYVSGPLQTTLGPLNVSDAQNLSFTATTVPEPSSWVFLISGLLGFKLLRKRNH